MNNMNKEKCELVLNRIYEKMESGEITPIEQNAVVSSFENQNPEFKESIIDDQIERLNDMRNKGTISEDDYKKQVSVWLSKRELYNKNVKEEEKREKEKEKKEEKKISNRMKKFITSRRQPTPIPVTESCIEFWDKLFK